ncbi:putative efflux protein, MATE family [Xenococcus sp. PCC 7305]|uniref:guanitoxin biosynthesis MATE family efflux transporter GntT n=1 Tax=Xenococcus sp. PCC 7305 TaxID=102125 RepID=UPI0002ACAA74|nr:guanitoxin biosynthesis MATE family efflux transporter GntT [Xenococcus sp. PCC 7305]ELS02886.1 putative efflux protein, MATE family [Xenococcus sp. PCC 7305]
MTLAIPNNYQSFLPRFYRLSFVSILSNLMVPLAGLFDAAFLGHLTNINYLAGVILASLLFDYLYRVLKFIRNSTNTMTAQAVGENDNQKILLQLLRSGLIALAIAIIILGLQYPIQKLGFAILAGSPVIKASGVVYFKSRIWGAPAVLLNLVLIGWFLGREKNGWVFLISLIANSSNVLLDYVMISQWGWGSMGAGLATALSQYLALFVGLVAVALTIQWQDLPEAIKALSDKQALTSTLVLKGNIFIRFLILISSYAVFTNLSATMGKEILTENGLLLQIVLVSQFSVQGIGMTVQTLIGNFQGQGDTKRVMPLVFTGIFHGLLLSLGFALIVLFFPQTIFALLTNHNYINQAITDYTIWFLPLLTLSAIAFILEGYFIGIKDGVTLRNSSLISFCCVFIPISATAWYWQNAHLLWASLTSFMISIIIILGSKLRMELSQT